MTVLSLYFSVLLVFLQGVVFLETLSWMQSWLPGTCLAIKHSFPSSSFHLPITADSTVFAITLLISVDEVWFVI